jgi:zinc and cadmium transporter
MALVSIYALGSVLLVSLISLAGIFTLSMRERALRAVLFVLVSLSVGALFGDVFIHLLPEAFEKSSSFTTTSFLVLLGILLFFSLEKFLHWRHRHDDRDDIGAEAVFKRHVRPLGHMILASDGLHNFIDGLIIGASYLVSIEIGIATTLAIALHEIPQEIGDFGILLHSGLSKAKALLFNFISALAAVVGSLIALIAGAVAEGLVLAIIPIAAGSFIYIAGSDLVPELHKTAGTKKSIVQLIAIVIGIGLMFLLLLVE